MKRYCLHLRTCSLMKIRVLLVLPVVVVNVTMRVVADWWCPTVQVRVDCGCTLLLSRVFLCS
jgi:hypothetical protein